MVVSTSLVATMLRSASSLSDRAETRLVLSRLEEQWRTDARAAVSAHLLPNESGAALQLADRTEIVYQADEHGVTRRESSAAGNRVDRFRLRHPDVEFSADARPGGTLLRIAIRHSPDGRRQQSRTTSIAAAVATREEAP